MCAKLRYLLEYTSNCGNFGPQSMLEWGGGARHAGSVWLCSGGSWLLSPTGECLKPGSCWEGEIAIWAGLHQHHKPDFWAWITSAKDSPQAEPRGCARGSKCLICPVESGSTRLLVLGSAGGTGCECEWDLAGLTQHTWPKTGHTSWPFCPQLSFRTRCGSTHCLGAE